MGSVVQYSPDPWIPSRILGRVSSPGRRRQGPKGVREGARPATHLRQNPRCQNARGPRARAVCRGRAARQTGSLAGSRGRRRRTPLWHHAPRNGGRDGEARGRRAPVSRPRGPLRRAALLRGRRGRAPPQRADSLWGVSDETPRRGEWHARRSLSRGPPRSRAAGGQLGEAQGPRVGDGELRALAGAGRRAGGARRRGVTEPVAPGACRGGWARVRERVRRGVAERPKWRGPSLSTKI